MCAIFFKHVASILICHSPARRGRDVYVQHGPRCVESCVPCAKHCAFWARSALHACCLKRVSCGKIAELAARQALILQQLLQSCLMALGRLLPSRQRQLLTSLMECSRTTVPSRPRTCCISAIVLRCPPR